MEERSRLFHLLVFCGLVALIACTSNRSARVARSTPGTPTKTSPSAEESSPPPSSGSAQTLQSVHLVITNARQLFEQGKSLFKEGRLKEARHLFRQSLESLNNAGYDFYLNPRLQKSYYDLLAEIQALELHVLIDPAEMRLVETPFLEEEPAGRDEIGELNLFTVEVDPALRKLVSADLLQTRFDIPVVLNDSVLRFLNYYKGRGRKLMQESLKRSGRYLPLFREIFEREGLPLDLIYMAHVESHFKPRAYSRAHARGIWQFVRGTGRLYGLRQDWWIDERSDVVKSTEAAARHLRDLYNRFEDWHLALAAYNVGYGRIERILKRYGPIDYWRIVKRRLLPRETRNYVPSILAALIISRHPERYGFKVEPDEELSFDTVTMDYQVDLRVVSESIGVPLKIMAELNPELRRRVTPYNHDNYVLKVPAGKGELAKTKLANLPDEKRLRFQHHRVRQGETLSLLARRYSTSVQAIAQVNRIRNVHRIKLGQDLMIPMSGWTKLAAAAGANSPSRHVVRKGDSLTKIAAVYGVSVASLLRWNNLNRQQIIYPGQRIRLTADAALSGKKSEQDQTVAGQ